MTDLIQFLHGAGRLIAAWAVWGVMLAILLVAGSIGDPKFKKKLRSFLSVGARLLLWLLHSLTEKVGLSNQLPSFIEGVSGIDKKHPATNHFHSIRDAKEFLADRISAEAKRQGAPLSDVEYKMLFFSASGHMKKETSAACEIFDRDYDEDGYEQKIGLLVASIEAEDTVRSPEQQALWDDALLKLSQGDHYLSVLAGPEQIGGDVGRLTHDRLRLVMAALFCLVGWTVVIVLCDRILGPDWNHPLAW